MNYWKVFIFNEKCTEAVTTFNYISLTWRWILSSFLYFFNKKYFLICIYLSSSFTKFKFVHTFWKTNLYLIWRKQAKNGIKSQSAKRLWVLLLQSYWMYWYKISKSRLKNQCLISLKLANLYTFYPLELKVVLILS